MQVHDVKTISPYFEDVVMGRKPFELRKNDRNYQVGDVLVMRHYREITGEYSGMVCVAIVRYVLTDVPEFGLMDGYAILGTELVHANCK